MERRMAGSGEAGSRGRALERLEQFRHRQPLCCKNLDLALAREARLLESPTSEHSA